MNIISKLKYFFLFLILLSLFNFASNQTRFYPDYFKNKDIFFHENDKLENYYYSLIDAKVLTKEEINLFIKKQGIHLTRDDCCQNKDTFNAWGIMKDESDYEEIYSNAKYIQGSDSIEYNFPVDKIENIGYTLYHKVWILNKEAPTQNLEVYFKYKDNTQEKILSKNNIQKYLVNLEITCESKNIDSVITYINKINGIDLKDGIKSIIFKFPDNNYSPAIAMHWTYFKIKISLSNFSFKGNSLCDKNTNPCISGYYCVGGICKKCHPSCFDCVNGALSTDCYSKCNTHAVTPTPEKGSCSIGYVDLNQFEDIKLENIVPPPRNNRLTISLWIFVSDYPETETIAFLNNSFSDEVNIEFKFETNKLTISCANKFGVISDTPNNYLNTWIYIKCAISYEKSKPKYLYIKTYDNNEVSLSNTGNPDVHSCNSLHEFKKYFEPDDYITLDFLNFAKLKNKERDCHVYMKQLVLFREYLPEEFYDNKYFNMEKLISGNTIELPEILFIIPFDELIKENNFYKVKSYSYQGKVEVNNITLNPKESGTSFTLYPPKKFKSLYLLDKNKKYASPDLISIQDIPLDSNVSIASYDESPLSCEDKNFLGLDTVTNKYICSPNCPSGKTMYFGLGDTKGFCNRECDTATTNCLYKQNELLNLQENFNCNNNHYKMFYYCEPIDYANPDSNIFYYDPNYTPANIVLDMRLYNLKSYIIEFWYFMAECGKVTSGYIFYTDQIQIQKVETVFNAYTTAHGISDKSEYFNINKEHWNQIVIEVYYDPRADRNKKTKVYLNTNYNSFNALEIDKSENDYKLNYIYFCNGRRATCNNLDLNWYCGYYRKLRVFNGNMAQRHVTFRYDDF